MARDLASCLREIFLDPVLLPEVVVDRWARGPEVPPSRALGRLRADGVRSVAVAAAARQAQSDRRLSRPSGTACAALRRAGMERSPSGAAWPLWQACFSIMRTSMQRRLAPFAR